MGFLTSIKNKGVFNQQRTGKTPTTLVTMRLRSEYDAVIIVPNSTLFHWLQQYTEWHGGNVTVLHNRITKTNRTNVIRNFQGTIITTYGLIKNDIKEWMKRKPRTIVVDEAHRLRNYKGMSSKYSPQFTKALMRISRNAESRYALTGTPTPNHPMNIFGILAMLFPSLFTSYWNFIDYYFKIEEKIINSSMDTVKEVKNFKTDDKKRELQEFMETVSTQRKRVDVMQWLNEVEPVDIELPAKKHQKKMAEEMHKYFETEDVEAINQLDRMIKERQIALSPKLMGVDKKGVIEEWLIDYHKDYPEKSLIITSAFTSYLKYLKKEIFKDASLLIGDTPDSKRHEIEEAFNQKRIKIVLANIEVAHVGMKLYGADTMIFTDNSLTYTTNEQMMDRLLATSEYIAKNMEPQDIFMLYTDLQIHKYLRRMFKKKASKTEIINNYARALKR